MFGMDSDKHHTTRGVWRDPSGRTWIVRLLWREIDERMECVGFSIEELHDPADAAAAQLVTATFIRSLPVGLFIQEQRRFHARLANMAGLMAEAKGAEPEAGTWREQARKYEARGSRGRPRMYDDDHYRRVAEVYTAAWLEGDNPTQAVEKHPEFHTTHSTAARWVRECRRRGFLGPTKKRKAGGILPPEQKEDA